MNPFHRWTRRRTRSVLGVRRLYFRALGAVSLVAFASLWRQIDGLLGSRGITPANQFLRRVEQRVPRGARLRVVPTLLWIDASDRSLHALCGAGTLGSALLLLGVAPKALVAFLWADYLSLMSVGDVFLGYQWDALLLETYATSLPFAPWHARRHLADRETPSVVALWLLRFLLFKLMFLSGFAKLDSGDPAWRDLSALTHHYETQPLPTGLAPHLHFRSRRFHAASTLGMFLVELLAPFLFALGPRALRLACAAATIQFQLAIALSGNYGFFNWLTCALTLPLLDDQAIRSLLPSRLATRLRPPSPRPSPRRSWPRRLLFGALAAGVAAISAAETALRLGGLRDLPSPLRRAMTRLHPFRTINTYGLFAVMTPTRPEIVVEGSKDGLTWRPYEFEWKPGRIDRGPRTVAPHQPRLDWQMWFAALDRWQSNPWFVRFVKKLLEGEPAVLSLLRENPFPEAPPRFIRAILYDYRFAPPADRARGVFWKRARLGRYCPVFLLEDGALAAISEG